MSIEKIVNKRGVRYRARFRDASGRQRTETYRTKKEAEAAERRMADARDSGEVIDRSARRRTFTDVSDEWMAANPAKRPSTRARDRSALGHHVLPALGDKRLGSIVPADVQDLVASMGRTLSPSTVVRNYNVIAAIFRYAADRDYIAKSPCRVVQLPRVPRTSVHIFTPGELAKLADAVGPEQAPMIWLGALLGLRWGEVAALSVADVDLLGRRLHVRHTVTRDEHGATVLGEPKSDAGTRTLTIPGLLAEVLAAHLAAAGLTAADSNSLLFPDTRGRLLNASNWRSRVWYRAAAAAGVGSVDAKGHYRGATFHDLRRTSATGLVASGVDVKTAQSRLGHSQVRLTLELYAQAVDERDRVASETLADLFMPSRQEAI